MKTFPLSVKKTECDKPAATEATLNLCNSFTTRGTLTTALPTPIPNFSSKNFTQPRENEKGSVETWDS